MTTRERFQAVLNFQPFDRLPVLEWAGWWHLTVERWRQEGLPADLDWLDIQRHFGLDIHYREGVPDRKESFGKLESPIVKDLADYEKRVRPHLFPWPVVDAERLAKSVEAQKTGEVAVWFGLPGFFWFPRGLLGIEPHFYAFYDQPELLHRMNADLADWIVRVIEALLPICVPDVVQFYEDMSYNHGSMLSKGLFEEFMTPYYRKVTAPLRAAGAKIIVDSDGDIMVPAHWFADAGVDGILPLERQAGVDIARLRQEHPRMCFLGHFDKMCMHKGEAALRAEFERLLPTAAKGGFVISCDHQTPPQVSYQDYQLYVRLFREYAEECGRMSRDLAVQPQ